MARTTLELDDALLRELKQRAASEGRSLRELATRLLREGLKRPVMAELPNLPVYDLGAPTVDINDRAVLERAMEEPYP